MKSEALVDLRSDTVTRPTAAMRQAMMAAPLGDDVLGDDPSTNALQSDLAARLGFDSALFLASGTQSNLCAILSHCQRGDEYIVGQMQHCYRWEAGGAAVLGSVQPQPLAHQADGSLALEDIEASIKPDDPHYARTRLLALENTLGGRLLSQSYLDAATRLAHSRGLQCHLDGARLFNASIAQAQCCGTDVWTEARRITAGFDSVSVCFSKGLGAPIGSVLLGSDEVIARARRIRKMAGGGMRQVGVLAAAAQHALVHHVDRLAEDHRRAAMLARGVSDLQGLSVSTPETNIVFVDLDESLKSKADGLLPFLQARGVLATGIYRIRFVTHLDVDDQGVERAVDAIRAWHAECTR